MNTSVSLKCSEGGRSVVGVLSVIYSDQQHEAILLTGSTRAHKPTHIYTVISFTPFVFLSHLLCSIARARAALLSSLSTEGRSSFSSFSYNKQKSEESPKVDTHTHTQTCSSTQAISITNICFITITNTLLFGRC